MLFVENETGVKEIMESNEIFNGHQRIDLGEENISIILTNISLYEYNIINGLKEKLANRGLRNGRKLSEKHISSKKIMKITCDNSELRKSCLHFNIEVKLNGTNRRIYTLPCVKPPIQCK
jgi:hypothetical protein